MHLNVNFPGKLPLRSLMFVLLLMSGMAHAAPLPAPPQLSSRSYLLIDNASGEVLASKAPDERIEPASLTKMMTALLVFTELRRGSVTLDEPVLISERAQAMPGSRMFVEAGKSVMLEDLLRGLIIQSGNDASVALAEHVAASEDGFAQLMNTTAESLGMSGSSFTNASGLPDPEHYTTANDLAILARTLINQFPDYYRLYSEREFTFNEIRQSNRNKLLWSDDSVDGIKTGHTQAAGYCLVASAKREDMRLISVVLGAASEKTRNAESQQLLNYGFRFFRTERVYAAGEPVSQARVWMGQSEQLPVGVAEDLWLTLPRDAFTSLEGQIELSEFIRAPIRKGETVGRSILKADERVVGEVPLLALQKVDQGGIFTRMKHSIQRLFQ